MRELVRFWRKQGIRLIHYLDDFGAGHEDYSKAVFLAARMVHDLENLGFMVNFGKSQLTPSHILKLLGLLIDTERKELRVPEDKWQKLREKLGWVLRDACMSARKLASISGQIISMRPALGPNGNIRTSKR
eukprot:Lithocolla_globosa_v1_NODE_748_length_3337_cov_38.897623.p2 type:complete len:131 gc:universal NODE_748_length_3337_cov_38.897623:2351-1959(-)